jgi:hypothetical protein
MTEYGARGSAAARAEASLFAFDAVALAVSRTNYRFLIHQHSKEIEAHFLNRSPVD